MVDARWAGWLRHVGDRTRALVAVAATIAMATTVVITIPGTASAQATVIGSDITGEAPVGLISFADDPAVPFSSPGDGFGIYQRGVTDSIPFALVDDSVSVFPGDTQGIIGETDTAPFFGIVDTVNDDAIGPVTATWVFDISGAAALTVGVDAAAMGDFEPEDTFDWTYSIDGGDPTLVFPPLSYPGGTRDYELGDGSIITLDDPINIGEAELTNRFVSFSGPIDGTGSELTIALTAFTDGGSEAIAFRNLIVASDAAVVQPPEPTPTPPPTPTGEPTPTPTPVGEPNNITPIHMVQGQGSTPAIVGMVAVEAIVVGDYQGADQLEGFFLQEEDADVDELPNTSEGIFVFCGECEVDVSEGDQVRVIGMAEDRFDMTQIDASEGAVEVLAEAVDIPSATMISLPILAPSADAFYEQLEGMRVTFENTMVVSEYFQLARFGQVVLYPEARPFQYTQNDDTPTIDEYAQHQADLELKRVILDDDNNRQNAPLPDGAIFHPQPSGFSTGEHGTDFFRGGDEITNLTGVLHWSWAGSGGTDAWRLRPTQADPVVITPQNPRPTNPPDVGGTLKVSAFNVLNYFTTLDEGEPICGPSTDQGCRGANSESERLRQLDKIAAAITAIDADIVGLMELENNASESLSGLVAALPGYAFIDTGTVGADAIKQGLIYKTDTVAPVGLPAILDNSVDPTFADDKNRPAVAQSFREFATNQVVTVAVNHLKSKGSDCDELGDPDVGDGQGNCNLTRTAGATALANWLSEDPTGSGSPDNLIIGDLNAYAGETPMTALASAGYVDVVTSTAPGQYSYVFDGQLGTLDYILANSTVAAKVTGAAPWNINADEVNVFDYNDEIVDPGEASFEAEPSANPLFEADPYRSSDHDPIIVGLTLGPIITPATCQGEPVTVYLELGQTPTDGDDVILGTPGDDIIAAGAGDDLVCAGDGNDTVWGQDGDDILQGAGGDDKLRGGDDDDILEGGLGADDLAGGRGNDLVLGGEGDDTALRGGTGNDTVNGGGGNDGLISGNGGQDSLFGSDGDDKLSGGPRPDTLTGGGGNDELRGNGGADTISGNNGDDALFGGPQRDVLNGGIGTDDCNGGTTGNDAPEGDSATNCETITNVP